ncbi:hypothetical protein J6590_017527 [Homalodisca vitripennis]|nr:hypothetical protein J6590_017527 [Homalodisca vitripennis]
MICTNRQQTIYRNQVYIGSIVYNPSITVSYVLILRGKAISVYCSDDLHKPSANHLSEPVMICTNRQQTIYRNQVYIGSIVYNPSITVSYVLILRGKAISVYCTDDLDKLSAKHHRQYCLHSWKWGDPHVHYACLVGGSTPTRIPGIRNVAFVIARRQKDCDLKGKSSQHTSGAYQSERSGRLIGDIPNHDIMQ